MVQLDFDSLPMPRAGRTVATLGQAKVRILFLEPRESQVFSISDGTLHQNSFGTGFWYQGDAQYHYEGSIDDSLPFTLTVRSGSSLKRETTGTIETVASFLEFFVPERA